MSKVSVTKDKLDILANAIANKSGEPLTLTLDEMVSAVDGIDTSGGGITPSGNIDITQTGVTDVTNYATATVNEISPQYTNIGYSKYYTTQGGQRKWIVTPVFENTGDDGAMVGGHAMYQGDSTTYNAIPTGTTITPTTSSQTIGGANYMMESAVTVNAVPSATVLDDSADWTFETISGARKCKIVSSLNFDAGYVNSGWIDGNGKYIDAVPANWTVTPTESSQIVGGRSMMMEDAVTVSAIPSNYVGSGITQRSSSDLTVSGATVTAPAGYYASSASNTIPSGSVNNVSWTKTRPAGTNKLRITHNLSKTAGYITAGEISSYSDLTLETKTVTPTTSSQTITPTSDYYYLDSVTVEAMPSGTEGTPIATKGTVSNHSVTVTPSVTNTTGYITGGTKTGTAVTVSASELVSGTKSITQNGTGIDVTAFASVDVNVPSSGVDTVVISYTYNDQTETIGTISCNKTYAECLALINDGKSEAIIRSTETVFDETYETGATGIIDTNVIIYTEIQMGVPRAEYRYSSNGTITIADPSSVTHLTATQNGDYYPDGVYGSVTVNVSSGGMKLGYSTATPENVNKIVFTGIKGAPTSLCITSDNNISTSTPPNISTILFDGTTFEGLGIGTDSNAQVSPLSSGAFVPIYDDGDQTITINTSGCQFVSANSYSLVYTYGGSASNIGTKEVQVGSGATSITFTGLEAEPDYFSCVFESSFGTSSGYQRVITVVNDGSETYGLAMDSTAKAQTSWTYSYSNGSLTITSQGTNNGGYFHQPGYYQLTYGYGGEVPHYQSKTVSPTTSQQVVTADSGYDALSQVIVNAMPSMTLPSSTSATSSGTSKATISASSSTQYLNIPTGYNATAQYYTISASGGGGSLTVATKTTTLNATAQTLSFSSLSGEPKYWFLRATTNVSSSGSTTYYYVTDCFYDGTSIKGNTFRIGSTRRVQNITSGITQSYSGGTLTITAGSSSGATPGQFYGASSFGYELVYVY